MAANSIGSTSRSQLDAARQFFDGLAAAGRDHPTIAVVPPPDQAPIADIAPMPGKMGPDQFEHDIAQIERVVAALREGEPDLEPWTSGATPIVEQRKPRSIWLFVGTIWLATVLVTGAATLAITSLL